MSNPDIGRTASEWAEHFSALNRKLEALIAQFEQDQAYKAVVIERRRTFCEKCGRKS